MAKIFISYRRQDSAGAAGRIYDRLRAHFGTDAVFMDIDSIPFGEDFREHIDAAVGQCDVVLAVIGPRWLGRTDTSRRIDEPRDFVRIEIESALQRGIPVIPVLLDNTRMPTEAEVPTSLAKLTYRNAIEVDQGRDFHPHLDRLIQGISFHIKRVKSARRGLLSRIRAIASEVRISKRPEQPQQARPPKSKSQDASGLIPRVETESSVVIDTEPLPTKNRVSIGQRVRAILTLLKGALPSRDRISWFWVNVIAVPVLVLLGLVIYIITDAGTVTITGTDASMVVRIDKKMIRIKDLGKPITLHTGPHDLSVTRGDLVVKAQTFQIHRGQETPLQVVYATKPPAAEVVDRKNQVPPGPSASSETKPPSVTSNAPARETSPRQQSREWTNTIGMKLVRIDAGEFLMGTTKEQVEQLLRLFPDAKKEDFDDEQPKHSVKITRPFFLGIHEVIQGQYQTVMGKNPSYVRGSDDLPVENVSWLNAAGFCNKLSERENRVPFYRINGTEVTIVGGTGYRLPSEAEWEYACRAKSTDPYPFGNDASKLGEHAWYNGNAKAKTHPVGQKLPNAWGLYDMLGNVWEWCADWYDEKYYASSSPNDPPGAAKVSRRVFRGGSWIFYPWFCRPAYRYGYSPILSDRYLGFRVAAVQE
jgi:formylglycine-generating enzyme required for sulfatase activity